MPTYTKKERLCSFQHQKLLFTHGNVFFCYPFRVVYLKLKTSNHPDPSDSHIYDPGYDMSLRAPVKCLISVPAKKFKRAVDRNLIKRLMREAYRKNKSAFYAFLEKEGYDCLLAFVYSGNQILSYAELESKITLSLYKLMDKLKNEKVME